MHLECSICLDALDPRELRPGESIVATKCGHQFHQSCVMNWLAANANCPKCRRTLTKKQLTTLYFDVVSSSPASQRRPTGASVAQVTAELNRAKEELELKEALVNSLEEEKNEIRATLEKELARERRACRKSVEELKKSIHSLREELSLKTHVQKLMSENEKEWKEELTNYPGADERMRSLLLIFANVKKELAKAQSDRSALRKASASENAKLLVDLARLRREGAEKNKQISELNEQLDSTKAELDDVRRKYEEVEAVHGLKNYGSNARLKRKRNEGVRPSASQPVSSKRHLDSTIVLSSDEDEDENLNPFKTPEHDDGYRAPTYLKVNRRITKGSSRFGFNGMGGSAPLEDPFEPPQGRAHLAAKKPRVPKEKLRPAAPAGCLPIAAFLDRK